MTPEFDNFGSLAKVNIINSGQGFTEFPNIYIESDTGYNAKIIPIFAIKRVGDKKIIITPEQVVNVVDCVGKF